MPKPTLAKFGNENPIYVGKTAEGIYFIKNDLGLFYLVNDKDAALYAKANYQFAREVFEKEFAGGNITDEPDEYWQWEWKEPPKDIFPKAKVQQQPKQKKHNKHSTGE